MANAGLITVGGIIGSEWRSYRRSPVCLIGLIAVAGFMINEGRTFDGWPAASTALYGYHLATTLLVCIISFLLTAGSLARDLETGRNQLVYSRPVPVWMYLCGKLTASISFGFFMVAGLFLVSVCDPVFRGSWAMHPPGPFLTVTLLCSIPMVVYTCSLAMFLTALSRRVLVAMPAFLLYYLCAGILRMGGEGNIDLLDFSMRLHEKDVVLDVPLHLVDSSFSHLLYPVHPALIQRCILYLVLSGVLAAVSGWIIARRRDSRWRQRIKQPRNRRGAKGASA